MTVNLTFWLILCLSASVIANFLAFWYIRAILGRLMFISENLRDLVDLISTYRNHLKSVYEMDMFYGDETLKFLMGHTKSLSDVLEEYSDVYLITEPQEQQEEQQEETDNLKEETEINAETKINQENVFYGGTRKSNN